MGEHDLLSVGEWSRWREDDRLWKASVSDRLDDISTSQALINTEVAIVKSERSSLMKKAGALGALIGAIISGLVSVSK